MDRRIIGIVVAAMFICSSAFTVCGSCSTDEKSAGSAKAAAVKVNNTICPVTGDKVNINNPVTVEYNGKIYNLCCHMCTAEFNKDPEKYSKIAQDQANGIKKGK